MRKQLFNNALALLLFCLSLLLLTGCEEIEGLFPDDKNDTTVYYGPETQVGDGMARTWVKVSDEKAKPLAVGINIIEEAVQSLKDKPSEVYTLQLPEQGVLTPFEVVTLDWNMMGHPEAYFVPHFDVHFYMISDAERLQIEGGHRGAQKNLRPIICHLTIHRVCLQYRRWGALGGFKRATAVSQPAKVQKTGYHPQSYTIKYDAIPG